MVGRSRASSVAEPSSAAIAGRGVRDEGPVPGCRVISSRRRRDGGGRRLRAVARGGVRSTRAERVVDRGRANPEHYCHAGEDQRAFACIGASNGHSAGGEPSAGGPGVRERLTPVARDLGGRPPTPGRARRFVGVIEQEALPCVVDRVAHLIGGEDCRRFDRRSSSVVCRSGAADSSKRLRGIASGATAPL